MASGRKTKRTVNVTVNEVRIPLNPYVQDVFSEVVLALLATLKARNPVDMNGTIQVSISPEPAASEPE